MGLLYIKVNLCVNVLTKAAVSATTSQTATPNVTLKNAGIQKNRKVILHSNYFQTEDEELVLNLYTQLCYIFITKLHGSQKDAI